MGKATKVIVKDRLRHFKPNDTDNLKVSFLTFCCPESIAHWRSMTPAKYLATNSVHTTVLYEHIRKEVIDWSDVVVFQRATGIGAKKLLTYCNMANKVTVYDMDDNFFDFPNTVEYEKIDRQQIIDSVLEIMNGCDAITTTTPILKQEFKKHLGKRDIYVLPNCLDYSFWKDDWKVTRDDGFIRIGYVGGSFHISDTEMVLPALYAILKKYDNVIVEIIGLKTSLDEYFEGRVIHHEPVEMKELPKFLSSHPFDIAIAPLLNNTFSACRSNIRLLQHSVYNTPCVVSPIGSYKEAIDKKFPCVVADDTIDSWIEGMSKLVEDVQLREKLGSSAHWWGYENYNIEKHVLKWYRAYKDIIKKVY